MSPWVIATIGCASIIAGAFAPFVVTHKVAFILLATMGVIVIVAGVLLLWFDIAGYNREEW